MRSPWETIGERKEPSLVPRPRPESGSLAGKRLLKRFFRNSLVVVALLYVDRLLWLTGLCSSCHCSTRRRMKILPVGMGLEREEEIHVGLYAHCAQGLLVSISVYASPFILSFN
ncbi:hypothetical protein CFC21_112218 [Triticum aestivum]|uniref:Uncharacterized protein n=2 Tax=Triticum aestivum TaxID=4565 RepID=A0A3B6U4B0_WHEAT|nr:hypothetical protein [Triticum aestivum]